MAVAPENGELKFTTARCSARGGEGVVEVIEGARKNK
jgi:hypothetical protein